MIPGDNLHPGMFITVLGWSKEYERRADDSSEYTPVFHTTRRAAHPLSGNALRVIELALPFFTAEVCGDGTVLILDIRDIKLHRVTAEYAASCQQGYQRRMESQKKAREEQLELAERVMLVRQGVMPPKAFETVPAQSKTCPFCNSVTQKSYMGNPANPESMRCVDFCTNCLRAV